MTDIYVAERALDMAPMIDALKFQPSDFELKGGWLLHVPSRHRYHFDRRGGVTIDAHCGCAALSARTDQQADLATAFRNWREGYWAVVETNRDFASHFAPVGRLRRFARDVRMAFRRLIRRTEDERVGVGALAPAE
jgi:hypothetical protein